MDEHDDGVPTGLSDPFSEFDEELKFPSLGEFVLTEFAEQIADLLVVLGAGAFETKANAQGHHAAGGFKDFVDHPGVRGIREGQHVPDHVQAGFFQGVHPGSPGLDLREPELLQLLERFTHCASMDFESLGEVALRGQALAWAVAAAEDFVAQFGRDVFAERGGFHGGAPGSEVGGWGADEARGDEARSKEANGGGRGATRPVDRIRLVRPNWSIHLGTTNLDGPILAQIE